MSRLSTRWAQAGGYLAALVAAVAVFGLSAPAARADPHGVFYTVIGQQQLFFNVLAALDQADYVETKEARDALLRTRSEVAERDAQGNLILDPEAKPGFSREENIFAQATETDLSGLLTRLITLEGNDLWTTYLLHQFALEATRVRNTDELVRIFCEQGLGAPNCEDAKEDPKKFVEGQESAFVRDGLDFEAQPVIRGALSALLSGTEPQQKEAEQTYQEYLAGDDSELPLAYDPAISTWWKKAAQDADKKKAAEGMAAKAIASYFPTEVNPYFWDLVEFDSNGRATVAFNNAQLDPVVTHEAAMVMLLNNMAALRASSDAAAERFRAQVNDRVVDDARPQLSLNSQEAAPGDRYGEITGSVNVPGHARVAATQEALGAIANTEQNRQSVPTQAESQPGKQQLVYRGASGAAAGIRSGTPTPEAAEGSVAGIISDVSPADDPVHHEPATRRLAPDTNPTAFHHEQGPAHFLRMIGHRDDRGGCGCSLEGGANHFGREIIRKINGF